MRKVVCRECKERGLESDVRCCGGGRWLMGWKPQVIDNKWHDHNPNRLDATWECTQGHTFRAYVFSACKACGDDWWYNDKPETSFDSIPKVILEKVTA